jgi:hypothetical protein
MRHPRQYLARRLCVPVLAPRLHLAEARNAGKQRHPCLRDFRGQRLLDALRDFRTFKKPLKLKDGMTEQE